MISESPSSSPTKRDLFLPSWWLFLFLKFVLAAVIPLTGDEAYYWVWSKKLDLSYFDHPPLVSWLMLLGHPLESLGHAVRWPAVFLGHCQFLFWWLILKENSAGNKATLFLALCMACPLLGLGGVIVTPDLPLLFFWSASAFFFHRILRDGNLKDYSLFGASLGLGFCSKYHIVLFPLFAVFVLLLPEARKKLSGKGLSLTMAVGLLFCLPVLYWNWKHDFVSFRFQLDHGFERSDFHWRWPVEYLLGELVLIFPLTIWAASRDPFSQKRFWLVLLGFGPLLFFLFSSFKAPTELNWPVMAFPALFMLAVGVWHPAWTRLQIGFWLLFHILLFGALFFPERFHLHERIAEPYRFKKLAEYPAKYQPLYTSTYQMASNLWYLSKIPVMKIKDMSRYDMYDWWQRDEALPSRFYVLKNPEQTLPSNHQYDMHKIESPIPDYELWEVHLK